MSAADDHPGCLACDLTAGRRPCPGGRIDETPCWVVEHCVGPLGVGTLIVKPKRHVLHVADLDADEAAELGPLLRRVAAAVSEAFDPEQVYVCLWSHADGVPGHIHWVVQPAQASADPTRRGPHLQAAMFERGEPPRSGRRRSRRSQAPRRPPGLMGRKPDYVTGFRPVNIGVGG